MKRLFACAIALLVSITLNHCGVVKPGLDEAHNNAEQAYENAEGDVEKVEILKAFLEQYPESPHTADTVDTLYYHLVHNMNDAQSFEHYLLGLMGKVQDPAVLRRLDVDLVKVMTEQKKMDSVRPLLENIDTDSLATYDDAFDLSVAASDIEYWEKALGFIQRSLDFATPEAIQAEYPDREFSKERLDRYAGYRTSESLAAKANAQIRLNRIDEALRTCEEAEPLTVYSYVGVPETSLNIYWGEALRLNGNLDEAMQRLIPDAVFSGNTLALQMVREIYKEQKGTEKGFDRYLKTAHAKLAPSMKDFTLSDYEKNPVNYKSTSRGRVTLLTFWFPT